MIIDNGVNTLIKSKLGFIPSGAKDPKRIIINARSESVAEKSTFKHSFRKMRGIVIASGFFEWKSEKGSKTPYYFFLKNKRPMAFASIYSIWTNEEGEKINTCSILTTEANDLLTPLHDRMPVILPSDAYTTWLDLKNENISNLKSLLVPFDAEKMKHHKVKNLVNSVKNNSEDLIKQA